MLKFHLILATGLALSACVAGPTKSQRSADAAAAERCRTTLQPGGGKSVDCTLWGRTTTTTATTITTTTTGLNGEMRTTTVERAPTGRGG